MSATPNLSVQDLPSLLDQAIPARASLFEPGHANAFRLFNGFLEGWPGLVVDIYGATAVLFDHADDPVQGGAALALAADYLQSRLPWLKAGIAKRRAASDSNVSRRWARPQPASTSESEVSRLRAAAAASDSQDFAQNLRETQLRAASKKGLFLWGEKSTDRILENNIWYALDLFMNQDASFYLDTRNLRFWAKENLAGRTVLNAFAYTGSLGVAACAGGASRVIQLDLSRRFLNLAKTSYTLNGFPIHKADFVAGDFYSKVSHFKRTGERFDCILLDPPFFSTTSKGVVDQARESARLINKVRPLIQAGGLLVAVNNALYLGGRDYMQTLEALCADGYLKIMELILVPEDVTGYPGTRRGASITDPAPFNHSTKIAVLEVSRKQQ